MSLQPVSLKKKKKRVREKGGGGEAGEISSGQHNKPPADIQRMGTGTDAADTHVRAHTHKCTMHFNCQRSHAKVQIVMQKHTKKKKPRRMVYETTIGLGESSCAHTNNCRGIPTVTGKHSQPEWAAHWTGRPTLLQAGSGLDQLWEFHTEMRGVGE